MKTTRFILICALSTLFVFAGCKKDKTKSDERGGENVTKPVAAFSYVKLSSGGKVEFVNESSNATSYLWNFGDGQTSTEISPSHTYTKNGSYTVTLTSKNSSSSDKASAYITINSVVSPKANFQYSRNASFTVTFTNTSTNATSYLWDFGDGQTSTATNPSHTFASRGTKTVTLTVYNGNATDKAIAYIDMTSQIKLENASNYPFSVSIDGIAQGNIAGGTTKTYDVNPGTHTVYVKQQSGYALWPTERTYNLSCVAGYQTSQSFNTVVN